MQTAAVKKYAEKPEKCAELLRLALAHMSRQEAGVHPISYAVWYEYVGGFSTGLREEIDTLTRDGGKLDEATTRRLYDKYVADLDQEVVSRLGDNLKRVVADVSDSATSASREADSYGGKLEVLGNRLKQTAVNGEVPALVRTAYNDTAAMRAVMNSVNDRLTTSTEEIEELRRELMRVREEALLDSLTGLLNRRAFDERIATMVADAVAKGDEFSLVMADIDHFKRINDGYGHLFGDRVIRAVGEALKAGVKGRDIVARYGGEEFAILLPSTGLKGAWAVAEGVRRLVAASRIRRMNNDEVVGNITLSAGVAMHRAGESIASLIERADAALYRAKGGGRNRVESAE
jgi:diguanylate cyclase